MKRKIRLFSTFLLSIYSLTIASQCVDFNCGITSRYQLLGFNSEEDEFSSAVVEDVSLPNNEKLTEEQKANAISHYNCENLGEVYMVVDSKGQLLIYVNGTLYSTKDLSVINCNEGLLTSWFFTDSCDFNSFQYTCIQESDLIVK